MSSVFDDRTAYLRSPYYTKEKTGDYTPFYIAVTICSILGVSIFLLNIILGCCSRYSGYWNSRHTGNRWLVSLWTATPHNQPSLDYTELQDIQVLNQRQVVYHHPPTEPIEPPQEEYLELKKRESEI